MDKEAMALPHTLTMKDRKVLGITGVTEVVSFDDTAVVLVTGLGRLVIRGQGLQLKNLTLEGGQVAVEGNLDGLYYEQMRQGGFFRRLMG